jgi:uncharacterized protein (UPF0332 family)
MVTAYRVVVEKTAARFSRRLHITTLPITKFWDYASKGDPILINMLRDGTAVFDTGCFGMAKQLLRSKMIKPTKETVWTYLLKAPISMSGANFNMKQATLSLYWAVMDSAHAALLEKGVVPESPEELTALFKREITEQNLMDRRYLSTVAEFHNLGNMIMRDELHKIRGDHYDRYRAEAERFCGAVKEMIQQMKS